MSDGNGNGAALFARLAAVEAELGDLDAELAAAEHDRDVAAAALNNPDRRPTALTAFALEEKRDQANEQIREVLGRRAPVADAYSRLLGYAAPIERRQREIAQQEAALRVIAQLRPVFALIDQAIDLIDQARPDAARAGPRQPIPSALEKLCRQWRADHRGLVGMAPARFSAEYALDAQAASERLARLQAGLP